MNDWNRVGDELLTEGRIEMISWIGMLLAWSLGVMGGSAISLLPTLHLDSSVCNSMFIDVRPYYFDSSELNGRCVS